MADEGREQRSGEGKETRESAVRPRSDRASQPGTVPRLDPAVRSLATDFCDQLTEFIETDRLADVPVKAGFPGAKLVAFVPVPRKSHKERSSEKGFLADPPCHRVAIHVGEPHVTEHELR